MALMLSLAVSLMAHVLTWLLFKKNPAKALNRFRSPRLINTRFADGRIAGRKDVPACWIKGRGGDFDPKTPAGLAAFRAAPVGLAAAPQAGRLYRQRRTAGAAVSWRRRKHCVVAPTRTALRSSVALSFPKLASLA
ncbi:MAG TPA: hypothetical protein VFQ52_05805, partial [Rhizomicrobium sp.]|nr:hypothetical protein [Rhizomicrobium sp.]